MVEESETSAESEAFITNAVIVACLAGIILVAALILLSPHEKQAFTQMWLKPWKLNLTSADTSEEHVAIIVSRPYNTTPIGVATLMGTQFLVFGRPGTTTDRVPNVWLPLPDSPNAFQRHLEGDTIHLEENSFFVDAVDLEGRQILFYEYPHKIRADNAVRFAFVVENDEGEDRDYTASIALVSGGENVTKAVQTFSVADGEQKTCTVRLQLTAEEAGALGGGNFTKVSVVLDTRQEVFFWIGNT